MANDPNAAFPKAMTDGDVVPPPAKTSFEPDTPLKDAGVGFTPTLTSNSHTDAEKPVADTADKAADTVKAAAQDTVEEVKGLGINPNQLVKDGVTKITAQAGDQARSIVETGKDRAGTALEQLAQMLHEAADQVDEKIGSQYGDYARNAASQVSGFADRVRAKDPDELFDEARNLIRQSPGAAIGVAAALGFGIARLVQSGIEAPAPDRA